MRKHTSLSTVLASMLAENKRLVACVAALKSLVDEATKLDCQPSSADASVYLKQCVGCEHLYQLPVPSSCDCMENPDNEYQDYIAAPLYQENCELEKRNK